MNRSREFEVRRDVLLPVVVTVRVSPDHEVEIVGMRTEKGADLTDAIPELLKNDLAGIDEDALVGFEEMQTEEAAEWRMDEEREASV